jgi:hypothetical protein
MRGRLALGAVTVFVGLALPVSALGQATGTVAGLRAQVKRFVTAELHEDGATVCAILNAPLNDTRHGVSCTARWDAKIKASLARSGSRKHLHADIAALESAAVSSDGFHASIRTPYPLLSGHARSHFYWTDDCWMLTS